MTRWRWLAIASAVLATLGQLAGCESTIPAPVPAPPPPPPPQVAPPVPAPPPTPARGAAPPPIPASTTDARAGADTGGASRRPPRKSAHPTPVPGETAPRPVRQAGGVPQHAASGAATAASPSPSPSPSPAASTPSGAEPGLAQRHVNGVFYGESPEYVGRQAMLCLQLLPPERPPESLQDKDYQCKPLNDGAKMTPGSPVKQTDGSPGVMASQHMSATLSYDKDDFDVGKEVVNVDFGADGLYSTPITFVVTPRRVGDAHVTVTVYSTDGVQTDYQREVFRSSSTVHVTTTDPWIVGSWIVEHWEALAGIFAALVAAAMALRRRLAPSREPPTPASAHGGIRHADLE